MSLRFSPDAERELGEIVARYPRKDAALLPVLWLAQREFGPISRDVRRLVAEKTGVSLARVESVVSFYTSFKAQPTGKYHIQVCRNLSCSLRGAEAVMKAVEEELRIGPGETTEDGLFRYSHVECLAACGGAPAMQIGADYSENLTPDLVRGVIGKLRSDGNDR